MSAKLKPKVQDEVEVMKEQDVPEVTEEDNKSRNLLLQTTIKSQTERVKGQIEFDQVFLVGFNENFHTDDSLADKEFINSL